MTKQSTEHNMGKYHKGGGSRASVGSRLASHYDMLKRGATSDRAYTRRIQVRHSGERGEKERPSYIYIIREEARASGGSRRLDLVMIYSQALYLCGLMSKGD